MFHSLCPEEYFFPALKSVCLFCTDIPCLICLFFQIFTDYPVHCGRTVCRTAAKKRGAAHSQTNNVGDGPATQVIRAMEIEDRIESQKAEMAKTMLNVMKIMDFLPTDSTERSILEYRHIDCLSWKQVCKEANMTRTPCNKYYNAGIDKLLTYKKVQSILQEFASSQEPSKP